MSIKIEKSNALIEITNLKIDSFLEDDRKTVIFGLEVSNGDGKPLFRKLEITEGTDGDYDIRDEVDSWYYGASEDIEDKVGEDTLWSIIETLNALALGLHTITYAKGADEVQINSHQYLHTQASIISDQKEWGEEDESKDKDLTAAPFWLQYGEALTPIHDIEDFMNCIA